MTPEQKDLFLRKFEYQTRELINFNFEKSKRISAGEKFFLEECSIDYVLIYLIKKANSLKASELLQEKYKPGIKAKEKVFVSRYPGMSYERVEEAWEEEFWNTLNYIDLEKADSKKFSFAFLIERRFINCLKKLQKEYSDDKKKVVFNSGEDIDDIEDSRQQVKIDFETAEIVKQKIKDKPLVYEIFLLMQESPGIKNRDLLELLKPKFPDVKGYTISKARSGIEDILIKHQVIPREQIKFTKLQLKILSLLKENPNMRNCEIVEILGSNRAEISRQISHLVTIGVLPERRK